MHPDWNAGDSTEEQLDQQRSFQSYWEKKKKQPQFPCLVLHHPGKSQKVDSVHVDVSSGRNVSLPWQPRQSTHTTCSFYPEAELWK